MSIRGASAPRLQPAKSSRRLSSPAAIDVEVIFARYQHTRHLGSIVFSSKPLRPFFILYVPPPVLRLRYICSRSHDITLSPPYATEHIARTFSSPPESLPPISVGAYLGTVCMLSALLLMSPYLLFSAFSASCRALSGATFDMRRAMRRRSVLAKRSHLSTSPK